MTNIGMNPYTGLPYNQDNFNGITPAAIPVSDQVKDTPAGNAVSEFPTTPDEFVKAAPYYGIGIIGGFGIKKVLDDICGTNTAFNNSKLHGWIENIANSTKGIDEKIKGWIKKGNGQVDNLKAKTPPSVDNFYKKEVKDVVEHMKVGTEPTWSMARQQYHGVAGMAADHFMGEVRDLLEKGKITAPKQAESIINNKKLSGIDAIKELEKVFGKGPKGQNLFEEFIEANKTIIFKEPRNLPIPFIKKTINLGEKTTTKNLLGSFNKYRGLEAANTKNVIAKGVQKAGLIAGEGLSGAMIGGGSLGVVINAFMLGGAIKKAVEAPKGEKVSTFMEEFLTNYFGFLITMPLAEKILYKTLGARNLGTEKNIAQALGKPANAKLIDKIKTVNKDATIKEGIIELAERFKNEQGEAAKATQAEIKALKSLATKETSLLQRPVKLITRFLSAGLGEDSLKEVFANQSTLKQAGNFIKRWGGGAARFIIILAVLNPILTKPFAWISHALFGTPTATKKEEEEKNKHKDENQQVVNNNAQMNQMNQANQMNQMQPAVDQNTAQASTAPASSNSGIVRTYVPSPNPVVLQPQQNSAIQAELVKSDKIIKHYGELVNTSH